MNEGQLLAGQKTSTSRSGIGWLTLGILAVVGVYAYLAVGIRQIRDAGHQQGQVPLFMPLAFGALVLLGVGVHKTLWTGARQTQLSKTARQLLSALIAIATFMVVSFFAGMLLAVFRAKGM